MSHPIHITTPTMDTTHIIRRFHSHLDLAVIMAAVIMAAGVAVIMVAGMVAVGAVAGMVVVAAAGIIKSDGIVAHRKVVPVRKDLIDSNALDKALSNNLTGCAISTKFWCWN